MNASSTYRYQGTPPQIQEQLKNDGMNLNASQINTILNLGGTRIGLAEKTGKQGKTPTIWGLNSQITINLSKPQEAAPKKKAKVTVVAPPAETHD